MHTYVTYLRTYISFIHACIHTYVCITSIAHTCTCIMHTATCLHVCIFILQAFRDTSCPPTPPRPFALLGHCLPPPGRFELGPPNLPQPVHRHGSMTNNLPLLRFGLQTIIRGVGKSFLCISSIRLGFGVGPILTLATSRKDPTPRCLELAQISVLAESPQGHPNPPRSRCLAQGE